MTTRPDSLWRSRWAAIGAAVAVTLGAGGVFAAHAATSANSAAAFVAITPCRLLDTRAGSAVGARHKPLGGKEVVTATVWGTNGECTIPKTASAVAANVTTLNGTATSYLTIWPADVGQPNASSNNWIAGQPPTPNKVDSKLSADGKLKLFNNAGSVDVLVDVVGYYESGGTATGNAALGGGGVDFVSQDANHTLGTGQAPTAIASVTVEAPSNGYVNVSAVVGFTAAATDPKNTVQCVLAPTVAFANGRAQGTTITAEELTSIAVTKGFAVNAGSQTFFLVCVKSADTGTITEVGETSLTAMFSPTRL